MTAQSAAGTSARPGAVTGRGLTTSGPKFQNMFQAALRDSPVADSVTVRYDGADEPRGGGSQAGTGSKKKWRKGH